MADRPYQVHVLVGDGKPGWLPFTYNTTASSRDEAISKVRKRVRERTGDHRVHRIQSAKLLGNRRPVH